MLWTRSIMSSRLQLMRAMNKVRTPIMGMILCCTAAAVAVGQEGWPPDALVACPAADDTLWASDSTTSPPRIWIIGALRQPCWNRFTDPIRERVVRSSAAQEFYRNFLTAVQQVPDLDASTDTARALYILGWIAPAVHRDVLLAYSRSEPSNEQGEHNHSPYGTALDALARYASVDGTVRTRLLTLLRDGGSPWVRQRALHTLMRLNDPWARAQLGRVPKRDLTHRDRELLASAMADGPCSPDEYWQECYGIEGQDFHGCKPRPPDHHWCAF
jgi:hypothetical protein